MLKRLLERLFFGLKKINSMEKERKVVKVHFSMQHTKWLFQYPALASGNRIDLDDLLSNKDASMYGPTECHSTVCDGTVFTFVHFTRRVTLKTLRRVIEDIFITAKNMPKPPAFAVQHIPLDLEVSEIPALSVIVAHAESENPAFVSRRKEGVKRSFFNAFCVEGEWEFAQIEQQLAEKLKVRVAELESRVAELERENLEQAEKIMEYENSRLSHQ